MALWEECKPCLKQTCMRFYTRTCHSGAGLVGRQVSELTSCCCLMVACLAEVFRLDHVLKSEILPGQIYVFGRSVVKKKECVSKTCIFYVFPRVLEGFTSEFSCEFLCIRRALDFVLPEV